MYLEFGMSETGKKSQRDLPSFVSLLTPTRMKYLVYLLPIRIHQQEAQFEMERIKDSNEACQYWMQLVQSMT